MRFSIKCYFFITLILFSGLAIAAQNPISWQLAGSFPNPVFANGSYDVIYTFTNQLPLQLVNPIIITKTASPANEFSYVDNCSGLRLTPQQSCTVQVNLNPVAAGPKTVQLAITGYNKDVVPLPTLTTQIPGASSQITAKVTQSLPGTMTVGTSANYGFSFTNNSSSSISGISLTSSASGAVITCPTPLPKGGVCTVTGTFTPGVSPPSVQGVSATFNYSGGTAVTISTSTNVPTASGVVASLVSPNYLPPVMVGGGSNAKNLEFLFTNYGPGNVNVTGSSINITTGSGGSLTTTGGSCLTTSTLNASPPAACTLTTTFTAPTEVSTTPFAVTASLSFTGGTTTSPVTIITSTNVVSALGTSRTLTFVNDCDFPVWFSLHGGSEAGTSCNSMGVGCPTPGTSCDTTNGQCFWENYAPTDVNYKLDASGGMHTTDTVSILLTTVDPVNQWSGVISASLLCDGSTSCGIADCGNAGGSASCSPGIGFTQPATQAEITMLIDNADSYDVEVINGFHLPISMTPDPDVTADNYSCGVPGSPSSGNGFGACVWSGNATPPSNAYALVSNVSGACTIGVTTCPTSPTNGQICGLDSALAPVCGYFLGYWSADQACGVNPTLANPYFSCNTSLSSSGLAFPASGTYAQLMACPIAKGYSGPTYNSCYLTYPSGTQNINTCCGCIDWWTIGIGSNDTAQSCTQPGAQSPQTDPVWQDNIQSTVQWLKSACPSDYVYPFDDKTSSFVCTNNLPGSENSVGYTITFCPGGDTGLPTASAGHDGRG